MKKVAIQGTHGAFHEIAAYKYFGENIKLVCCNTFADVFDSLDAKKADACVVAIGNSRSGDIAKVYDILIQNHLNKVVTKYWIGGEVYIKIDQCLLGVKGASLETIEEVHSQTPALSQCTNYLRSNLGGAQLIAQTDTAKSAQLVSKWNDPSKAAIASASAAKIYGLKVIAKAIQDDPINVTRFLIIELGKPARLSGCSKSSLLLKTNHTPGSLAKALTIFGDQKINLSYLQSVPVPKSPFQYRFYIDIEARISDERVKKAFKILESDGYGVDVLGCYYLAKIPS